jgi:hypothetical protein
MADNNRWVIWDLDNCLADDRPRIKLIDWSKYPSDECWSAYHAAAGNDTLGNLQRFNEVHGPRVWGGNRSPRPLFITARPASYRMQTEEWIFRNLSWGLRDTDGPVFNLLMRADGDDSRTVDVKRNALRGWLDRHPYAEVVGAYDDVPGVIKMYAETFGIHGEVLAIHNEETHAPRPAPIDKTCDADIDSLALLRPQKAADHAELRRQASAKPDAASVLAEMAALFRERNAGYKDNYKMVAPIIRVLFPAGVPPELVADDRWHLFELAIVKLTRFAVSGLYHSDSARDAAVYLAMIDAINQENKERA